MNFEFNKLLKQVNDSLPPIITIRYEDKDLSFYSIDWSSNRPEYKRVKTIETGSKVKVKSVLYGMLTYAQILNSYMQQKIEETEKEEK